MDIGRERVAMLAGVGRREERSLTERRTGLRDFQAEVVEEEEEEEETSVVEAAAAWSERCQFITLSPCLEMTLF